MYYVGFCALSHLYLNALVWLRPFKSPVMHVNRNTLYFKFVHVAVRPRLNLNLCWYY